MDFLSFAEDVSRLDQQVEYHTATLEENLPEGAPDLPDVKVWVKVDEEHVYLVDSISYDEDELRIVIEVVQDAGPA